MREFLIFCMEPRNDVRTIDTKLLSSCRIGSELDLEKTAGYIGGNLYFNLKLTTMEGSSHVLPRGMSCLSIHLT